MTGIGKPVHQFKLTSIDRNVPGWIIQWHFFRERVLISRRRNKVFRCVRPFNHTAKTQFKFSNQEQALKTSKSSCYTSPRFPCPPLMSRNINSKEEITQWHVLPWPPGLHLERTIAIPTATASNRITTKTMPALNCKTNWMEQLKILLQDDDPHDWRKVKDISSQSQLLSCPTFAS